MVNTTIQTYATTQAHFGMPVCAAQATPSIAGPSDFGASSFGRTLTSESTPQGVWTVAGAECVLPGIDANPVRPTDVVVLDGAFSGPHVWSPPI